MREWSAHPAEERAPAVSDGTRVVWQAALPDRAPWAISADGRRLAVVQAQAAGQTAGVTVHDTEAGSSIALAMAEKPGLLAFSVGSARGGKLAATVGDTLQVWTLASGERWQSNAVPEVIDALRLSDDGQYVLALTHDRAAATRTGLRFALLRWRLQAGQEPLRVALGSLLHAPDLDCLVSGDGTRLLVDGQPVDLTAAAAASAPPRIEDRGQACRPSGSGSLQTVIAEKQVVISDVQRGLPLVRLEHPAQVLKAAIRADGAQAATLDDAGSLRIWALAPSDLIAQACARAPSELGAETFTRSMPAGATHDACGRPPRGTAAGNRP